MKTRVTEEDLKKLLEAAKPLIKYLNDHHDPHTRVIVGTGEAELVSGVMSVRTEEFYKDWGNEN